METSSGYKKNTVTIFILFFCLSLYPQEPIPFEGPYNIRAYNDEIRIGFNHVYKKTLEDNQIDTSLSNEENISGELTIYIPKARGRYPLILVTHGWANYKYAFLPIARYLSSNGYAVAVFTSKRKDLPKDWLPAFSAAYGLIKKKTEDPKHSLYGLIDTENLGILAHSMGGAAALYYANFMHKVKALVAIHPYNGASPIVEVVGSSNEELGDTFLQIKSSVLFLTSEADRTAYPEKTYRFFKNLNKEVPSCFLSFKDVKHNGSLDIFKTLLSGGYNEESFRLYSELSTLWFDAFLKNKKEGLAPFKQNHKSFTKIKNLLYTEMYREHEPYPSYASRNLE